MNFITAIVSIGIFLQFVNETEAIWFSWGGLRGFRGYGAWGYGEYRTYNPGYPYWQSNYYPYRSRRSPAEIRFFECKYYSRDQAMLSCVASYNGDDESNVVECETTGLFDDFLFFNFYAVSASPVGNLSQPETVKFPIYPKLLEEHGWLSSTFVEPISKKQYVYSIHSGQEASERGFRVNNATCYAKLVKLFTGLKKNETIVVGRAPEKLTQVDVVGGILLA